MQEPNIEPTVIREDGSKVWINGDDKFVLMPTGSKYWIQNGLRHRDDDLPAVVFANGGREWWVNGMQHRENGPAVDCSDGTKMWFLNNLCHRVDGPAVVSKNSEEWWLYGKRHRSGGLPAMTMSNGVVDWYENGLLHRVDGPASTGVGRKEWYLNGLLHRIGGPAVEGRYGVIEWWINGERQNPPPARSGAKAGWTDLEKTGDMVGQKCVISLEEIGKESTVSKCGVCNAMFLHEVLSTWLQRNRTCPHCRSGWNNYIRYI